MVFGRYNPPMRMTPALLATLLLLVAGCGQSGPLYLPGNPSEVQEAPTTQDEDDDSDAAS